MSHIDNILFAQLNYEKRRRAEKELSTPLKTLDQRLLPAKLIEKHGTYGGSKSPRFTDMQGNTEYTPILCHIFCINASQGMPEIVPTSDQEELNFYRKNSVLTRELSKLRKYFETLNIKTTLIEHTYKKATGNGVQMALAIPVQKTTSKNYGNKSSIELSPSNLETAYFAFYLVAQGLVTDKDIHCAFTARIRKLYNELKNKKLTVEEIKMAFE